MNCQHCLMQEASFHYRSNINGEITEQHLCANCAREMEGGLLAGALSGPMELLFGGGLLGGRMGFAPRMPASQTFTGNLQVPAPQKSVVPLEADDTLKQRRVQNALQQELQAAIEAEHYERAAELRDEIRKMEQGS